MSRIDRKNMSDSLNQSIITGKEKKHDELLKVAESSAIAETSNLSSELFSIISG